MALKKFEITDSDLEHNTWRFPASIKLRALRDLDEDDFLVNHRIDPSYSYLTARFKLLVAEHARPSNDDAASDLPLPLPPAIHDLVKDQGWISDEYEHLWSRSAGISVVLTLHGVLTFLLQTPRDDQSFCSLSLVNRSHSLCAGVFVHDATFDLNALLAAQPYLNTHARVPRDFAVLPFAIYVRHVHQTFHHVAALSRHITAAEHGLADTNDDLDEDRDFKLEYRQLNVFNLEQLRLQTRSKFELDLGDNLLKYVDEYHRLWAPLFDRDTTYIDDMREKIEQQMRYSEQVKHELEIIPRRIKNHSKAARSLSQIFGFIAQRDNRTTIELAKINRRIAEESRRDNLLNIEIAKATSQVAEETRQDSAAMKTIAVLTLTFLPGTAVASLFSMNGMFNWSPDEGEPLASPYLWVYFAVTVPLTLLVFACWIFWFMYSQHRYKRRHDEGLKDVEKELKMRLKSATMTW